MKKIFLALAAVAALAACSKSEAEFEAQTEISFTPVTKNITKAMVTDNTFPISESFNVWAWYKQLPNSTSIENWQKANDIDNQWYIVEKPFINRDATTWKGQTSYYWPKLGSLLFAGYYPTSLEGNVSYEFENESTGGKNKMIFSGIYQSAVAATGYTEDIMYFNMTGVSSNAGPVAVVFRHALSWITVNVKKSEGSPKIVINEIKFTKVNDKGTGTVDNSAANNEIVWVTEGNMDAATVFGNNVELATTNTKLLEPLFIPQTMEGELVINYTIYSSDSEFFTETYSASLNSFQTSEAAAMTKWEPAKHYTYNIEIGTSEILIEPTVQTWDNVTVPVESLK
ncbi:MAG: fimbrillin family protein [Bacteroidales bacterium]|nr:fimbrillin family protein [Bacteroidales bacterium]